MFDAAIRLLGLVLVIFAVLLASRWLTEWTAPRPVAKLPSMPMAPPENSVKMVGKLFGTSEVRTQALDGLQLVGVFAGSKGGGFATFRTRSGAISVFTGDDIAPGVKLKQIERDRVVIVSAGIQKELRLAEGGGEVSSPIGQTPAIPQQVSAQQVPAMSPQEGGAGNEAPRTRRLPTQRDTER
jgi:hypothetical protein